MSDEGENLLRQIWAFPEDPAHVSVYADWLIEHGDSARGEYIQLALLAAPTDEQDRRKDALFRRNRARWLGDAVPYVHRWADNPRVPTFPARVSCTPDQLAAGFETIRDLAPELVIEVMWEHGSQQVLQQLPLGQLHGLSLRVTHELGSRAMVRLADRLEGLRRLELVFETWQLTPEGLVAALERIGTVTELELGGAISLDAHLRALLDHPVGARLVSLEVCKIDDATLREHAARAFRGRTLAFHLSIE